MNAAVKPIKEAVRLCGGCHKPLVRKIRPNGAHERLCEFNKRKHCSSQCAGVSQALSIEKSPCAYCGKKLVRKTYSSGFLEASSSFRARKYCNTTCSRRAIVLASGSDLKDEIKSSGDRVFPLKFESCKPPKPEKIRTIQPPITEALKSKSPGDYTKKTEQGFFKETPRGIFRWNGFEWVRSTKSKPCKDVV